MYLFEKAVSNNRNPTITAFIYEVFLLALLVKSDKKTLFSTKSLKFYNIAKNKVRIFCKYTPEIAPRLLREKIYEKISSVMNLVRYIAPLLYIRFFESYNIFFPISVEVHNSS